MKHRPSAADRLRPLAHVARLNGLDYDTRKRVAADLSLVLRERAAYRLYFWLMLIITVSTAAAFAYAITYLMTTACK